MNVDSRAVSDVDLENHASGTVLMHLAPQVVWIWELRVFSSRLSGLKRLLPCQVRWLLAAWRPGFPLGPSSRGCADP